MMDAQRRSELKRSRIHLRLALLRLGGSLWIAAILLRLLYLQVWKRDELRDRAAAQQQEQMSVDPERGTIFDRNARELAVSVDVESVWAVPAEVGPPEAAALPLGRCLSMSSDDVLKRLRTEKRFVLVKRKADPLSADCVRSLGLSGVHFLPDKKRFYPARTTAAHVLGYVGMENRGMYGVEYAFDGEIRGEPGEQVILTDARRRRASSRVDRPSVPGRSLYLTIDETLEHVTETELLDAVRETRSKSGLAILMRPETGEILAMAGAPTFNPNVYNQYPDSVWRNRAVTDPYEPGSTFKVVTAAAALEEQVATEDERIDCGRGSIRVEDRVILDHHPFDILRFREIVERSSNVGMIRIGQRLGRDRLLSYVRAFGFGDYTGVGLAGESRGIVHDRWSPVTLAAVSFGQEIAVTPLQMVSAVSAIATSGYLMRPRLVREIRAPGGEVTRSFAPEPVRRVVSTETARRLTEMMIGVVERGTGRRAAIPGYTVAGKTGTAQKATIGGYSESDYVASFAGFVPASRPALVAIVILDSPVGDHTGGTVAASVFARILERSLHYLGVPAEAPEQSLSVAARWPDEAPLSFEDFDGAPREAVLDDVRRAVFPPSGSGERTMPTLYDLPARDAVAQAVRLGLVPQISGTGRVAEQFPAPGAPVELGSTCRLVLTTSERVTR